MKMFLMVVGLAASVTVNAQATEGTIIYEKKINVHKRMPPEAEQFKAMVPEFSTSKMELSLKATNRYTNRLKPLMTRCQVPNRVVAVRLQPDDDAVWWRRMANRLKTTKPAWQPTLES